MAVFVKRDGKTLAEVEDSNEAFAWLLKHQGTERVMGDQVRGLHGHR